MAKDRPLSLTLFRRVLRVSIDQTGSEIIKAKTDADFSAKIGETFYLFPDWNKVHIFKKKTEEVVI